MKRTRNALLGLAAALIVAVGAAAWLWASPDAAEASVIGGPFQLTDGAGKTVTNRSFHGKYLLVYFGYTFCPDVCPTTLNTIAGAMDALGAKADQVQPLFITVDPARDTAPVVQQYAAAFSPRIDGLTGTPDQIAAVAHEYRVYYAKHVTGPAANDYTMDHSSVIYLMAPNGQFDAVIRADETAPEMAADISKYLS